MALAMAGCREDGIIQIKSLKFEGVEQIREQALAQALQTRKGSRLPWGRKSFFDRRAFDADLQRIEAFYRDRGFPEAQVTSFDITLNDAQDQVDVVLHIREGEPILVDGVELDGFGVLGDGQQRSLQDTLPLRAGQPLDRQLELATRERALNVLRDEGYPYARVSLEERDITPRSRRVVVHASPGILAHFGDVEIAGPKTVAAGVVARQLTFKPGEVFTRREMRESQGRLHGLELFEFVNVESRENQDDQPPTVPVRVTVAEGKHQRVTFGLGYGSEEHARARVRWDHLNLFKGAQHLGAEAKWSSLDRGVRLQYREPYFLASALSLNFEGQVWQAAEPVYDLTQLGGRVTLRLQPSLQTFWSTSLINEYQRSTVTPDALLDLRFRDELIALGFDPRDGLSRGTLSALAFDVGRNTANSVLDARRGYVLSGHAELAGSWLGGSYNYRSFTGEVRHYLTVANRLVLANRARIGTIDPAGDVEANIPFYKRFFLGGASSVRGWGRLEVSPLSGFGLPIGGLSMIEGSTEVRLPLFGKLGGVAFLDVGNVSSEPWDFSVRDLRFAAGPGVRYLTPVGPVRVDFGYQLNQIDNLRVNGEPEQRHWRLHFSIGQAF